jgi:hypothetical protein
MTMMKPSSLMAVAAAILLSGISCLAQTASPSPTPTSLLYQRPDKHERVQRYIRGMFGPVPVAKTLASSGISTWRNSPEEWGPHWSGYGKRVASNFGKNIIRSSTRFGLEEAFKLDSRFVRSPRESVGKRIGNALISPLVARNERGHKVFGFPNVIANYTAPVVAAETWYPRRYTWRDGVRSGTISLGTSALWNLIREFAHRK